MTDVEQENVYTVVDQWNPDSVDAELEVGVRGRCEDCGEEMIESNSGAPSRLLCPGCDMEVGLSIIYPAFNDGGEPGESKEWPMSGKLTGTEDSEESWTFEYAIRGTHNGHEIVTNEAESTFGSLPEACCEECGGQFGYAAKANVVSEPGVEA